MAATLDPRQEELYASWRGFYERSGTVPPREAFDPVDVPGALSTLVLAEVTDDGALRFRLVGTDMVTAWGEDFTGRCLHEVMKGSYHDFIRSLFDDCIERRVPIFSHSQFQWNLGRSLDTRRLMLPFTRNDNRDDIGFVLVSQIFDYGRSGPDQPLVAPLGDADFVELKREALATAVRG